MATEGEIRRNKKTGERAVFQGGQWISLGGGQAPLKPDVQRDVETLPYAGPKASADLTGAQIGNRKDATEADILEATRQASIRKANAEAASAETAAQVAAREASSSGKMTEAQAGQGAKAANLKALQDQINRTYQLYVEGPGSTSGLGGLADYLPSGANSAFDASGANIAEIGGAAFKVPGMGSQSDADVARFVAANQPSAGDRDVKILEKMTALQNRLDRMAQELNVDLPSPWIPQGGVTKGELSSEAGPYSTPEDRANATAIFDLYAKGAGLDEIMSAMQARGMQPTDEDRQQWIPMIEYREKTKGRLGTVEPAKSGNRSDDQSFLGSVFDNPFGAAGAGAANMATLGAFEKIAPEAYQGLKDQGGWTGGMMAGGEVAGSIGGTAALGRIGGNIASRIAPWMLKGGKGAQFGRNLAADATYSGGHGAVTTGDPLTSAAIGAGGSAGGQLLGKIGGRALGGFDRQADASFLNSRGVPTTLGQDMGGFVKSVEDASTSMPGVGDLVNARWLEGLEGLNQAAFREMPGHSGATGADGIREAGGLVDNSYQFLDGATMPLDATYAGSQAGVRAGLPGLPAYGREIDSTLGALDTSAANGSLAGRDWQSGIQSVRGDRASIAGQPFSGKAVDALGDIEGNLMGLAARQGPPGTEASLAAANALNAQYQTLLRALDNGPAQKADELFTAGRLDTASRQGTNAFGGRAASITGNRPFYDLTTAGQKVLPSGIPDSGTGRRIGQMAMGSAAIGGAAGGGFGALSGGDLGSSADGAQTGGLGTFTLAATLALASTKSGQKVLKKALIDRPAHVRGFGRELGKRSGIFGTSTLPFILPRPQQ